MKIILNDAKQAIIDKAEQEIVEQEKQEYYLLGSFHRTRGLKMFYYSAAKDEVHELTIKYGDTIHLIPKNGELIPIDYDAERATVDSRNIHFEALNLNIANRRVQRWKDGVIDQLSNLKPPRDGKISFDLSLKEIKR